MPIFEACEKMAKELDKNFISAGLSIFVVAGLTGASLLPSWITLQGSSCGIEYLGVIHTIAPLDSSNALNITAFVQSQLLDNKELLPWDICFTKEARLMLYLMAFCLLSAWLSALLSVIFDAFEFAKSPQLQMVKKSAIGNVSTVLLTCLACALCYWLVVVLGRREAELQGTGHPAFSAHFGPAYWLVVTSGVLALVAMAVSLWRPPAGAGSAGAVADRWRSQLHTSRPGFGWYQHQMAAGGAGTVMLGVGGGVNLLTVAPVAVASSRPYVALDDDYDDDDDEEGAPQDATSPSSIRSSGVATLHSTPPPPYAPRCG